MLSKDQRISLFQDQEDLDGRIFEPAAKNSPGMSELVKAVEVQA